MGYYRKKPVVIEAIQWIGDNEPEIAEFVTVEHSFEYPESTVTIPTLEGNLTASSGDWVIKGIQGEFYPCKPDIFEATYEPVDLEVVSEVFGTVEIQQPEFHIHEGCGGVWDLADATGPRKVYRCRDCKEYGYGVS
jgi:hypothetical protein